MSIIPAALQFLFGPDELPWAPLPDPGPTPNVTPIITGVDVPSGTFTVDLGVTYFADDGPVAILHSFDLPTIIQRGILWNQATYGSVYGIVSGNIEIVENYGDILVASMDSDSRGVYLRSWGLLQNYGSIISINKTGIAIGYESSSNISWNGVTDHINAGQLIAWSGYYDDDPSTVIGLYGNGAEAVKLFSGGNFVNSGLIAAYGRLNATAFFVGPYDTTLTNTGLIEAVVGPGGEAHGIYFLRGGDRTIENTGTINSEFAIYADNFYQNEINLHNSALGKIVGTIYLRNTVDQINNDGLIRGDIFLGIENPNGVYAVNPVDSVVNRGAIEGNIIGGDDDTFIDTRIGSVAGSIILGLGDDTVYLGSNDIELFGRTGSDVLVGGSANDHFDGGSGNDTLKGGFGNDMLKGGSGFDYLLGQDGRDSLFGDDLADTLLGGNGSDFLNGGLDNDRLLGEAQRDLLFGDAGDDIIDAGTGDDTVDGSGQRDSVFGGSGFDLIDGGAGNDTLTGGTDGDTLLGAAGFDILQGDAGDDVLNGGASNDVIFGNAGNDTIIFELGGGTDTLRDFTAGAASEDVISLVGFGVAFDTFAEVIAAATQSGNHVAIDFGNGDALVIRKTLVGDLHADDFTFG